MSYTRFCSLYNHSLLGSANSSERSLWQTFLILAKSTNTLIHPIGSRHSTIRHSKRLAVHTINVDFSKARVQSEEHGGKPHLPLHYMLQNETQSTNNNGLDVVTMLRIAIFITLTHSSGVLYKPHGKCEVHVNGQDYAIGVLEQRGRGGVSGCGLITGPLLLHSQFQPANHHFLRMIQSSLCTSIW